MTRAKVQKVVSDRVAASGLIVQARAHLESARLDGIGDDVSELELAGAVADADAVVAAAAEGIDG